MRENVLVIGGGLMGSGIAAMSALAGNSTVLADTSMEFAKSGYEKALGCIAELEENGLVFSEWETDGAGPARRVYQLTVEGMEVLGYWIEYMIKQADNLSRFVKMYQEIIKKEK